MKKPCLILLCQLTVFALIGQERLTSYENGGTNLNSLVKAVDGRSYLLQSTQDDIVHVFELTSVDTKVKLHSKKIPGIFGSHRLDVVNSKISYGYRDKFFVYDFVENETDSLILPSGLSYYTHSTSDSGRYLIRTENADNDLGYHVYHSAEENYSLREDKEYIKIYEGYVLEGIEVDGDYTSFILYDYQEGTTDTLATDVRQIYRPIQVGNLFYFLDGNGIVYSLDTETKEKRELQDFVLPPAFASNVRLLEEDGTLYAVHSRVKMASYNLETGTVAQSYTIATESSVFSFQVNDKVLIGETFYPYRGLVLQNFVTGESRYIEIEGHAPELLEDKYLVYFKKSSASGGYARLEMIDLQTMETFNLGVLEKIHSVNHSGAVQIGDKAVVVLNDRNRNSEDIYEVDLQTKDAIRAEKLDETTQGFSDYSEYFLFKNGVIIYDNALMYYQDGSLEILMEAESKYDINLDYNADKIFFRSRDSLQLMTFDGDEVEVFADSFSISQDFFVTEKAVFIYDKWEDNVNQINLATGGVTVLHQDVSSPEFHVLGDEFFFSNEDTLFRVDPKLNFEILATDFIDERDYFPLRLGEELLFPTRSGLKRILEDGTTDYLIEGNFFSGSTRHFMTIASGKDLLIGTDTLYHYDGSELVRVGDDEDLRGSFRTIGEEHFHLRYSIANATTSFFYNTETKTLQEILQGTDDILTNHFTWGDQLRAVILTRIGGDLSDVRLVDIDSVFDQLATQLTLSARKSDTDSEVVLMDDHGLVRVGSALVVLQPNGEPRQVTDIFVGGWDHNFLQDDKLIYFIGKNWRLGSQLYVYDLNSTAVESPVGIPSAPVRIYPNPVTDVLYIDIPDKNFSGDMRYEIYTSEGHRSGDGRAGGSINVSDLIPGFYFIYLREGEFESVLKFVKE